MHYTSWMRSPGFDASRRGVTSPKTKILYDAALRNLQTLSEATQLLPDDKKAAYPAIPWREISGFRNILVHNYLGNIDSLTVASVIEKHLQPLHDCITTMLQEHGGGD